MKTEGGVQSCEAKAIAGGLGIEKVFAEVLPYQKEAVIESVMYMYYMIRKIASRRL